MRIRSLRFLAKEGIRNVWKNKFMSFAAFGIVLATLFTFGVFLMVGFNLSHIVDSLGDQAEMRAYLYPECTDAQVAEFEDWLGGNPY
ncbi:MAG: ABC transporter permease, partial [Oscillospiraceae bacterium]|nr:ABC transporter permease [Oscillospiraceae bacterium]